MLSQIVKIPSSLISEKTRGNTLFGFSVSKVAVWIIKNSLKGCRMKFMVQSNILVRKKVLPRKLNSTRIYFCAVTTKWFGHFWSCVFYKRLPVFLFKKNQKKNKPSGALHILNKTVIWMYCLLAVYLVGKYLSKINDKRQQNHILFFSTCSSNFFIQW